MKKIIKVLSAVLILSLTIISSGNNSTPVIAEADTRNKFILGGDAFGIRMFSDGVMVIEVEEELFGTNEPSPAFAAGIKEKDIIKSANGIKIYTNEQFSDILKSSVETDITLCVERNSEIIELTIQPKTDSENNTRCGMWIKDSAAGIGTVTYYNCENSTFGALGHGIYETESELLIPLSYGEIVKTKITDTDKSKTGKVGSLNGYFSDEIIGKAYKNTNVGIFGKTEADLVGEYIELGTKSEVKPGKAEIYCTVEGYDKKAYDIEIKRINTNKKDMIIEIIDPELLEITGGIVQGMSGSPIIQNEKLVGAVTHVLVNEPTKGYGIFIENMLDVER